MLAGCVPWPEDLAARYRREAYWRNERLGDLLRHWARVDGGRIALVAGGTRATYAELDRRADRLAAGLLALGIAKADRVVVQLSNVGDLVVLCIALFRIGALPVFALAAHRRSEIVYLCKCSGAAAYVIPDVLQNFDYRDLAREVRSQVPSLRHVLVSGDAGPFLALHDVDAEPFTFDGPSPGDVAFFLLSGGTTGMPKLIPRTHDDYAYQLRATAEAVRFTERSVYLAALPVAHNAALGCPGVLGTLRSGGKAVLAPSPSPDEVFPLVEQEGVTHTTLMPSLLLLWIEIAPLLGADLSSVLLQVGGAKLSPDVARKVRPVLGSPFTHWFGMAEGLLCHTRLDDPDDVWIHTQGRPLSPADELRVVDDEDRDVLPGEIGHLLARGPYTLRGYYRAESYNATAFTSDGFLRTGDLVRIREDGNMVVEGRVKDIINRGGEKISAEEVEVHLLAHPGVRNAAVVAMPDAALGEKTCAFIVPSSGAITSAEVKMFLHARGVADYKIPDRMELVTALPMTSLGKINRRQLADLIAQKRRDEHHGRSL